MKKIILALLILLLLSFNLQAQAPFYAGKTIRVVVGYTPGGTNDLWARVIAQHMGKYIPGNPNFIVQNMPVRGHSRTAIPDLVRHSLVVNRLSGGQPRAFEKVFKRHRARPSFDRVLVVADPTLEIVNFFSPQGAAFSGRLEVINGHRAL